MKELDQSHSNEDEEGVKLKMNRRKPPSLADNFRHTGTRTPQSYERVYRMIEATFVLDIIQILSRLEYARIDKSNLPCLE